MLTLLMMVCFSVHQLWCVWSIWQCILWFWEQFWGDGSHRRGGQGGLHCQHYKGQMPAFSAHIPVSLPPCPAFIQDLCKCWYEFAHGKINFPVGPQDPLLTAVKRQKLAWFRHVTRHESLSKTILQGILGGGRCMIGIRKCWMDNIKE